MIAKTFHYYKDLIWVNRTWFLIITVVFVLSAIWGVLTSLFIPSIAEEVLGSYARSIKPDLKEGWDSAWYIYQRNLLISSAAAIFSFFFGIAALFVTFINGFLLGLLFGYPKIYSVLNPGYLIALIVPHGIFEYFATFLALAFGLRLGINWMLAPQGKRVGTFLANLKELFFILILTSLVLFFAALVEGYLTKMIADCLFGKCVINF